MFNRNQALTELVLELAEDLYELKQTLAVHSEVLFDVRSLLAQLLDDFDDDGET